MTNKTLWLDEIDSTNKYALRNFKTLNNKSLLAAQKQTEGVGRFGKTWLSPENVNLYASFILKKPAFNVLKTSWIGGLATLETLRKIAPALSFWLKWPNDIFIQNKKIAGVLCESVINSSGDIDGVVIGIGINLNMSMEQLLKIDKPATSIFAETNNNTTIHDAADILLSNLNKYEKMMSCEGENAVYNIWKSENKLIGKNINIVSNNNEISEVKVLDIKESGQLYVIDKNSNFHTVFSGDVSISKFH
ncbi:MAG: biotin--[acetyl-CoA-carboxylase] ligase [bacterium]|nr:biotin--[acetyl-CoA-carboxylase] ligase [bacterium]